MYQQFRKGTPYVSVAEDGSNCVICVEDDGIGATDEQIEKLNTTPHYMVCDKNTTERWSSSIVITEASRLRSCCLRFRSRTQM